MNHATNIVSRGRIVQPSALHPSPTLHRRDLPAIEICTIVGGREARGDDTGVSEIAITTPESRCHVRGSVIFVPSVMPVPGNAIDALWPTGTPAGFFGSTAIWVAKRDESTNGSAERVPVQNVAGNKNAFQTFPDIGCLGYAFETTSGTDEIWARINFDARSLVGFEGKWILRVAVAEHEQMREEEWNRVVGRFAVRAIRTCNLVAGSPT